MVQRPIPADLLEMWPEHVADEPEATGAPHTVGTSGAFELVPDRTHDCVVEPNQRLGNAIRGSVVPEGVGVAVQESDIFI